MPGPFERDEQTVFSTVGESVLIPPDGQLPGEESFRIISAGEAAETGVDIFNNSL